MSRQLDDYIEGRFEIYGEEYRIIEPKNLNELIEALQVKDKIENMLHSLMHDEDNSGWENLLQEQEEYIQNYVENIGEFENYHLVSNLNYLLKKYGLRMGELESLLKISAGYISRTVKENSNKRLSIDVLWKIAELFEVDLVTLISTDLNVPNNNIEIVIEFMRKLRKKTESYEIESEVFGGIEFVINPSINKTGLFEEFEDGYIYHPKHLNPKVEFLLKDDIVGFPNFQGDRMLIIIPFYSKRIESVNYDFMLVNPQGKWERFFYTTDTPFYNLSEHAELLYNAVRSQEFDVKLSPGVKNLITNFLG